MRLHCKRRWRRRRLSDFIHLCVALHCFQLQWPQFHYFRSDMDTERGGDNETYSETEEAVTHFGRSRGRDTERDMLTNRSSERRKKAWKVISLPYGITARNQRRVSRTEQWPMCRDIFNRSTMVDIEAKWSKSRIQRHTLHTLCRRARKKRHNIAGYHGIYSAVTCLGTTAICFKHRKWFLCIVNSKSLKQFALKWIGYSLRVLRPLCYPSASNICVD